MRTRAYLFLFLLASTGLWSCRSNKGIESDLSAKAGSAKAVKAKYAKALGVNEKDIQNLKLYSFIDDWYGVPYKYAGQNKSGIDCSGFAGALYRDVYNRKIGGPASSIYLQCRAVSQNDLREGDLVFFAIGTEKISHVGVYLQNNKFVHASTKKGVMINDLNEAYYKKYFYKGGRLKILT